MDQWERLDHAIRDRGDEVLLSAWEEAKREDARTDGVWARMRLWDKVQTGAWSQERRAQARHVSAKARRRRALDEGIEAPDLSVRSVGRALAMERRRAWLTQEGLARAAEVPRSVVANVERGRQRLTYEDACRFADVLGASLDAFRSG